MASHSHAPHTTELQSPLAALLRMGTASHTVENRSVSLADELLPTNRGSGNTAKAISEQAELNMLPDSHS